jgi:hypothetical protein
MCKIIKLTFPDRELWEGPKLELYNTHTQNKRKHGQIGHNTPHQSMQTPQPYENLRVQSRPTSFEAGHADSEY